MQGSLATKHPKLIDISGWYPHILDQPGAPPSIEQLENQITQGKFTGSGDQQLVMDMFRNFNATLMVAAKEAGGDVEAVTQARKLAQARQQARLEEQGDVFVFGFRLFKKSSTRQDTGYMNLDPMWEA